MNFEEKVMSMKIYEIVDAMIQGIRKEHVKLDFTTFGKFMDGVCYGCGATNAICEINEKVFNSNSISLLESRADFLGCDYKFLDTFERAINWLRYGDLFTFIMRLKDIGINVDGIENYSNNLKSMFNSSIQNGTLSEKLKEYENLRDWLKQENI